VIFFARFCFNAFIVLTLGAVSLALLAVPVKKEKKKEIATL